MALLLLRSFKASRRAARLKQAVKSLKDEALQGMEKDKLLKVMTPEYLSSEESEVDEDGEFRHFSVRRLPWQKDSFRALKDKLEATRVKKLTPQHRRQMKTRVILEIPKFVKNFKYCNVLLK
ncbi:uncharacterized protein LOC133198468 [Saccostrea echinata]|uniref:uncharacterized protein LOC133198468 n=1 Tax=Saccostrea echinata TaxID=191078 RepID=UPI002A834381|nr:uncharacterized protein LOC133198468 [Saccostrea echinata]